MKDVFVGQDRVTRDAVKESLEHAPSTSDHIGILLGLALLDRILADTLLGGYRWDDERRVQPSKPVSQRLELGVSVPCSRVLDVIHQQS